jgi:hypothetical protein
MFPKMLVTNDLKPVRTYSKGNILILEN